MCTVFQLHEIQSQIKYVIVLQSIILVSKKNHPNTEPVIIFPIILHLLQMELDLQNSLMLEVVQVQKKAEIIMLDQTILFVGFSTFFKSLQKNNCWY